MGFFTVGLNLIPTVSSLCNLKIYTLIIIIHHHEHKYSSYVKCIPYTFFAVNRDYFNLHNHPLSVSIDRKEVALEVDLV